MANGFVPGFDALPQTTGRAKKTASPIVDITASIASSKIGTDETKNESWYSIFFEYENTHADGTVNTTRPTNRGTGVSITVGETADETIQNAVESALRRIAQGTALLAFAQQLQNAKVKANGANAKVKASGANAAAREAAERDMDKAQF